MNFTPRPDDSFADFSEIYFRRCRERVPQIEANAAKWTFEDLIPGLSDFDTRLIVRDGMSAADWNRMSTEVGRTHLELARERREWARTLEHLPGINLQWSELTAPEQYSPEFGKWTFYRGDETKLGEARAAIAAHRWSHETDGTFHWKTFTAYHGPYDRAIDPAINLGPYENKYPLHSRLMHYFAPPLHAAVCLLENKTVPGKLASFRRARELLPDPALIDLVLQLVENHYESPEFLTEPGMTALDRRLEAYLQTTAEQLRAGTDRLACSARPTPAELREAVRKIDGGPPLIQLFENTKFARLMKGRLWFYGQNVLWFESHWLIQNELNRMRRNFFEIPFRLFARHILERDLTPEQALDALAGDLLDREQVAACRRFAILSRNDCPETELKPRALEIAAGFDPFLEALETLMQTAKGALRRTEGTGSATIASSS